MATVVLAAAGSAIGGAIGGSVLGIGAATIGQAAGAIAGGLIDQAILGSGSRVVDTGRARSLRIQSSTEGAAIPICFGRIRVAGQIIWSTRYLETVRSETQGGKATGGQRVREFSYSISFAVGLCEGPIERIGRVWADGKPLDTTQITMRVYNGDEEQLPDPKIEAVEGAGLVPAYRGLAYVVFEDLPVGDFGNRIPQLNFEVFRSALTPDVPPDPEVYGEPLRKLIKGVALSPGTGDFALDPVAQQFTSGVERTYANINSAQGRPDMLVALDQLDDEVEACDQVSLVVSWFGDDLRCGRCRVEPKVEIPGRSSEPDTWATAGLTSSSARTISTDENGRPNYGSAPSDVSVIRCIQELKGRGKKVMMYPFLLMDITADNTLENPYTGVAPQPPFPWRGRITTERAPGVAGSTDKTQAAETEVDSFFGVAVASDFSTSGFVPSYSGAADDWTWRRFILHLAACCKIAGGVDAFCVGSELVRLTTARSGATTYPAVEHLRELAAEVRKLLPDAKISYGADWTEYWGHQPDDGSGDRIFHLDPFWADANVDFVGIDDYTSLADWRHQATHLDREAGFRSTYELGYLKSNVEGGQNYDWFYASDADREAQIRTPILDAANGEDWVFRPKDIRNWWLNAHHDRIGGVRQPGPTAWVPEAKPVWLTETGCPTVDLGANRPNLFFDPKSSESGIPSESRGARDDEMQRRFLQAKLDYWFEDVPGRNPVSSVYGTKMIPESGVFVWTWDLRPWPDFPLRESVWSDGPNHRYGHWITGRVSASGLAETVAAICARAGMLDYDVSGLHGVVYGYAIERTESPRQMLQPLMTAYGFDAFESGGKVVFRMREGARDLTLVPDRVVSARQAGEEIARVRGSEGAESDAVRASYLLVENEFRQGASEAVRPGSSGLRVAETSLPLALPSSMADAIVDRWLAESARAPETLAFSLPQSALALEPSDVIGFDEGGPQGLWRVERVSAGAVLEIEAARVDPSLYLPRAGGERTSEAGLTPPPGPLQAWILDLPLADGTSRDYRPFLAVSGTPWPGTVAVYRADAAGGFVEVGRPRRASVMGRLAADLPAGLPGKWNRTDVLVEVSEEVLSSSTRLGVLNGANQIAVETSPGAWEVLQYRDAVLEGLGRYRLSNFLRGQRGTEALAAIGAPSGARVVLIDGGLFEMPLALDELELERSYRIGPARFAPDHESYLTVDHAAAGLGLRPFAPVHLKAARQTNGDLAVSWVRRTRIGGDSWFGEDVPLGEDIERYQVRTRQGGTVLRTLDVDASGWIYSAAEQAADGVAAPFDIEVAQFSTIWGAGLQSMVRIDD